MSRLTRKPRLFGSRARRLAGTSAMLLTLASQLAGAQDVAAEATPPLRDPHEDDAPLAIAHSPALPPARHAASPRTAPFGWAAAGVLLALALYPPGAVSREGA